MLWVLRAQRHAGAAVPGHGAGAAARRGLHQRLRGGHLRLGVHAPRGCAWDCVLLASKGKLEAVAQQTLLLPAPFACAEETLYVG